MTLANTNGIQIEYETFGEPSSPAFLLIAGLSCQLFYWQDEFCQQIADGGFHVIRYDNRDVGLSTKLDEISTSEAMERLMKLMSGETVSVPYTIEDMADDAAGLLDGLNIDRAHICGKSMGGFIAQTFALKYPSRLLSLTSIYSHSGNSEKYPPTQEVAELMMAPSPDEREPYIDFLTNYFKATNGSGLPFDEKYHRALAGRAFDRAYYPEGVLRQFLAIITQKDRAADLDSVKVPSLVIHGDDDPVVPLAGGEAAAAAIPGSELMIIKGMGHDLPILNVYWNDIKDAMLEHVQKVKSD